MKKTITIGIILMVVGVLVFAVPFAATGFDITKLSTSTPYEEKTYVLDAAVSSMLVQDGNADITFGISADNKIHMTCNENAQEWYEIGEGPALTIKKVSNYKWYDHIFSINFQTPTLNILLPKGFTADCKVELGNGQITAKSITAGRLELRSGNGYIITEDLQALSDVAAITSSGEIHAKNVTAQGKVTLSSWNGAITGETITGTEISVKTSNGHIRLANTLADSALTARSSTGEIHLDRIGAGSEISLYSSNGGLRGSVLGKMTDFTIRSKTGNGENALPEKLTAGAKELTAESGNGDIKIEFTE